MFESISADYSTLSAFLSAYMLLILFFDLCKYSQIYNSLHHHQWSDCCHIIAVHWYLLSSWSCLWRYLMIKLNWHSVSLCTVSFISLWSLSTHSFCSLNWDLNLMKSWIDHYLCQHCFLFILKVWYHSAHYQNHIQIIHSTYVVRC